MSIRMLSTPGIRSELPIDHKQLHIGFSRLETRTTGTSAWNESGAATAEGDDARAESRARRTPRLRAAFIAALFAQRACLRMMTAGTWQVPARLRGGSSSEPKDACLHWAALRPEERTHEDREGRWNGMV